MPLDANCEGDCINVRVSINPLCIRYNEVDLPKSSPWPLSWTGRYATPFPLNTRFTLNLLSKRYRNITTFFTTPSPPTPQTRHGINPADKSPLPPVPLSTQSDVDAAVSYARTAFKSWSRTTTTERRTALLKFADLVASHRDAFEHMLVREQGKAISQARFELDLAIAVVRGIVGLELKEILKEDDSVRIFQRHVPLGVCVGIVPWNAPVVLACGKIAAASYAGNTMIIKPSPYTPYCDLKLGELGLRCFPAGRAAGS